MARTIYTNEQIIEAGRRLEDRGEVPITPNSLRDEVGGGKPVRMHKIWLNATQSTEVIQEPDNYNIQLPPEIQESVSVITADVVNHIENTIIKCNAIATQIADKRVAVQFADMKKTMARAERSEQESYASIDKCDDIIEDQKEEIENLTRSNNKLENNITKLEANNDEFKRNEKSAKERIAELDVSLKESHKAKSEADINVAVLNKTNENLERQLVELQQALSISEKNNATVEAKTLELTKQLNQSDEKLNKSNVKIEEINNNLTETKIKLGTEQGKSSEQKSHIDELNRTIEGLHTKITTIESDYNNLHIANAKDKNEHKIKGNGKDK